MIDFKISKDSSLPLHIQLLDELRHKIMSGELAPHNQLPSEWELVENLNISRATIQRAWQSAQDEGLIYRVAGKGTFVAEPVELESDNNAVGFIIPEYRGTFAVQMLSGAERVLRKKGYHLIFASTERDLEEENRLFRDLLNDRVCGCIIVPVHAPVHNRMLAMNQLSFPVVLMDRPINGLILPCVMSNNYAGGLQAMNHLIELGHRRIIFVARPHLDLWPVAERYRAYQDAMQRIGEEPAAPFTIGEDKEMSSYEAYFHNDDAPLKPLVDLLQSAERPSAIFAVNDWIALKVQRAIELARLRNPQDVSLIGFDDEDIAAFQNPPLTTIAQDPQLMGAEAARRLITLMEGDANREILTLLPTKLIVRESTVSIPALVD